LENPVGAINPFALISYLVSSPMAEVFPGAAQQPTDFAVALAADSLISRNQYALGGGQ